MELSPNFQENYLENVLELECKVKKIKLPWVLIFSCSLEMLLCNFAMTTSTSYIFYKSPTYIYLYTNVLTLYFELVDLISYNFS